MPSISADKAPHSKPQSNAVGDQGRSSTPGSAGSVASSNSISNNQPLQQGPSVARIATQLNGLGIDANGIAPNPPGIQSTASQSSLLSNSPVAGPSSSPTVTDSRTQGSHHDLVRNNKRKTPSRATSWQLLNEVDERTRNEHTPVVDDSLNPIAPNGSVQDALDAILNFDVEDSVSQRLFCLTIKKVDKRMTKPAIIQYFGNPKYDLPVPTNVVVTPKAAKACVYFEEEGDYLVAKAHRFDFGQVDEDEFYQPQDVHDKYYRTQFSVHTSHLSDPQVQIAAALKSINVRIESAGFAKDDKTLLIYPETLFDYVRLLNNSVNKGVLAIPSAGKKPPTILTPRPSVAHTTDPMVARFYVSGFPPNVNANKMLECFKKLVEVGNFDREDVYTFAPHREAETGRQTNFGFLQTRNSELVEFLLHQPIRIKGERLYISRATDSNKKHKA